MAANPKMFYELMDLDAGKPHMMEAETLNLRVGADDKGIGITATDQWSNWHRTYMRVPEGQVLGPGIYPEAACTHGRLARIEITLDNPACLFRGRGIRGWFTVRQLTRGAAGELTSLEVVYQMSPGESGPKGFLGTVRWNAYPMYITVRSSADSKWGAISDNFHGDTSFFKLTGNGSEFEYEASVPYNSYIIRAHAPTGQKFKVGTYQTTAEPSGTKAGLQLWERDVTSDLDFISKCEAEGMGTGTLKVRKVRYDSTGKLLGLHASFEGRCATDKGAAEPALSGDLRINI
ncbi:hypothetical protein ACFFGH_32580 [Lysobacter korlensis]|uniref:Uncharacterized protein n=1 Tax=Lysobacter korlensis TaxID=553636 RepID=A0ABV6S028_9GAMM